MDKGNHEINDTNKDQQLIKKVQEGDKAAFDVVFNSYEPRVFAFAMKLTHSSEEAREVVQEVFLKVWEKRKNLDPQNNFSGFLYTIAKNIILFISATAMDGWDIYRQQEPGNMGGMK